MVANFKDGQIQIKGEGRGQSHIKHRESQCWGGGGGGGAGEEQKNEAVHTNGVSIHLIQTLMWGVAY